MKQDWFYPPTHPKPLSWKERGFPVRRTVRDDAVVEMEIISDNPICISSPPSLSKRRGEGG